MIPPDDAVYLNDVDGAEYLTRGENGRLVIRGINQGGYDCVDIDLIQLLTWIARNMPQLLDERQDFRRLK